MLFLANIAGFLVAKWRVLAAILGGILLVIVLYAAGVRVYRWFNPPPKLDEKQIQKAQDAIAKGETEKMKEILAESDTAEDAIDSSILEVEHKKNEAKKNYDGVTNEDLAAELNRRAQAARQTQ